MVGKQLIWKRGSMDENPSLRPGIHPSLVGGTIRVSAVEDRTGVPDHMWRTCTEEPRCLKLSLRDISLF